MMVNRLAGLADYIAVWRQLRDDQNAGVVLASDRDAVKLLADVRETQRLVEAEGKARRRRP